MSNAAIEVTADPGKVAAARTEWAAERERRLSELLTHPRGIRRYKPENLALVRENRERSLAALSNLRDDVSAPPEERINAIIALHALDVSASPEDLAELGSSNDQAALGVLQAMHDLFPSSGNVPAPLKRFLIQCIASHNSWNRSTAAHMVCHRRINEAAETVMAEVCSQPKPDIQLLRAAGRLSPCDEVLQIIMRTLESDTGTRPKSLDALIELGQATSDPALRRRVVRICFESLRHQRDYPSIAGDTADALALIAKLEPLETAKGMLRDLANNSEWLLLRDYAAGELQKLEAIETARSEKPGGGRAPVPTGMTAGSIAALCVDKGLLTASEADQALQECGKRAQSNKNYQCDDLLGFLDAAGRLCVCEVKTGNLANRHDLMLLDLAQISAGRFRPEAALERYDSNLPDLGPGDPGHWIPDGVGEYFVQFIHGHRLYRFQPDDMGRWRDAKAVIIAVHRALADTGVEERYSALEGTGDMAVFVFAKPAPLKSVAAQIGPRFRENLG